MSSLPGDPDMFGQVVLAFAQRRWPGKHVELAAPLLLTVDGRHLGLENLWRTILRAPEEWQQTMEHHLERVMEGDQLASMDLPFATARSRIMPRIQPVTIFETLDREQVAHVPWVNDTVIVFVLDTPKYTVSISTEQMVRWGTTVDDLEDLARTNLQRYAPDLEVQVVRSSEGGRAAIIALHDGYDAARLLLGDLHQRLAGHLGTSFYVAAPARDMFVAMTDGPEPFLDRLKARSLEEYRRMPYPICADLFVVSRDGVAGTKDEGSSNRAAA